MIRLVILIFTALLLCGCLHPYVPTVKQGNVLSQKQIDQIQKGMTKDDVRYILGAPVIQNNIEADRWDYIYTEKVERKKMQEKRLSLYFKNGVLYQIDNVNYDTKK